MTSSRWGNAYPLSPLSPSTLSRDLNPDSNPDQPESADCIHIAHRVLVVNNVIVVVITPDIKVKKMAPGAMMMVFMYFGLLWLSY